MSIALYTTSELLGERLDILGRLSAAGDTVIVL